MEALMTAIVTALTVGAATGLNETIKQAIVDAYAGVKTLIQDRYSSVNSSLEALEQKPKSALELESLKKSLAECEADQDKELLQKVQLLLDAIEKMSPQVAKTVGINVENINAVNMRLRGKVVINSTDGEIKGLNAVGNTVTNDFEIDTDVQIGK